MSAFGCPTAAAVDRESGTRATAANSVCRPQSAPRHNPDAPSRPSVIASTPSTQTIPPDFNISGVASVPQAALPRATPSHPQDGARHRRRSSTASLGVTASQRGPSSGSPTLPASRVSALRSASTDIPSPPPTARNSVQLAAVPSPRQTGIKRDRSETDIAAPSRSSPHRPSTPGRRPMSDIGNHNDLRIDRPGSSTPASSRPRWGRGQVADSARPTVDDQVEAPTAREAEASHHQASGGTHRPDRPMQSLQSLPAGDAPSEPRAAPPGGSVQVLTDVEQTRQRAPGFSAELPSRGSGSQASSADEVTGEPAVRSAAPSAGRRGRVASVRPAQLRAADSSQADALAASSSTFEYRAREHGRPSMRTTGDHGPTSRLAPAASAPDFAPAPALQPPSSSPSSISTFGRFAPSSSIPSDLGLGLHPPPFQQRPDRPPAGPSISGERTASSSQSRYPYPPYQAAPPSPLPVYAPAGPIDGHTARSAQIANPPHPSSSCDSRETPSPAPAYVLVDPFGGHAGHSSQIASPTHSSSSCDSRETPSPAPAYALVDPFGGHAGHSSQIASPPHPSGSSHSRETPSAPPPALARAGPFGGPDGRSSHIVSPRSPSTGISSAPPGPPRASTLANPSRELTASSSHVGVPVGPSARARAAPRVPPPALAPASGQSTTANSSRNNISLGSSAQPLAAPQDPSRTRAPTGSSSGSSANTSQTNVPLGAPVPPPPAAPLVARSRAELDYDFDGMVRELDIRHPGTPVVLAPCEDPAEE